MSLNFEVYEYTYEVLIDRFEAWCDTANLNSNRSRIHVRPHSKYFETYFDELKATRILEEEKYIDNDYLQDYAGYYSQCFSNYEKECRRLHFFANLEFSKGDIEALLGGNSAAITVKQLQSEDNYLGFIVLKPIPEAFVGRTCLKTYKIGQRHFPIIRNYPSSLFGLDIRVRSLAFQEQDHTVAACATSALWSIFHGTGKLFQHSIPSPIEITRFATTGQPDVSRELPNDGLTLEQSAHAIKSVGLAPHWVDVSKEDSEYTVKGHSYAYTKGKVPILLNGEIFDIHRDKSIGLHAVAVSGYRLSDKGPEPQNDTGFLSIASAVTQLYAHDDQVGPFAKMQFKRSGHSHKGHSSDCLTTSFQDSSGNQANAKFLPDSLLVPLAPSIRISFDTIHSMIVNFDSILEKVRLDQAKKNPKIPFLSERFIWDVFLCHNNDFKSEILNSTKVDSIKRKEVLLYHLPRFLWRARILSGKTPLMEILFDSTGIAKGQLVVNTVEYAEDFCTWLRQNVATKTVANSNVQSGESRLIWEYLANPIPKGSS